MRAPRARRRAFATLERWLASEDEERRRAHRPLRTARAHLGYAERLADLIATFRFDRPVAVLGDVHGRSDLLDALLPLLGDRPLLVAGDVIDRGLDSAGTIARLLARGAVGVRGNHEDWLLAWLRGDGLDDWVLRPMMGGLATLRSYGVTGRGIGELETQAYRVPAAHRAWLETLALVGDLEVMGQRYWLIHGGVPGSVALTGLTLDEVVPFFVANHPSALLWGATEPEAMPPLGRPLIMGHQAREEPLDTGDVLAIDTGSATLEGGGRLTALLLPERRFITVGP